MDFNIYIKGGTGNAEISNKFVPEKVKKEKFNLATSFDKFKNTINQFSNGIKTVANFGDSVITKAAQNVPVVALIVQAVKLVDKLITTTIDTASSQTGYWQYSTGWNNLKNAVGYVLNPGAIVKNWATYQLQNRKANIQSEEQSKLLGYSAGRNIRRGV